MIQPPMIASTPAGLSHSTSLWNHCALVARAWDLGALEQRYEDFIDEFTGLEPAADEDVLRAQTRLVHEWRRFPFLDPLLPLRLHLPEPQPAQPDERLPRVFSGPKSVFGRAAGESLSPGERRNRPFGITLLFIPNGRGWLRTAHA